MQGYFVPIVVGIDNGGVERINEYTPWPNSQYGGGDGSLYIDFIVETLKPHIDQHYRTLPNRESTAIWGSSLGGLISHYGALKYQNVFSKAGIYSPSYWFSDSVWMFTTETGRQEEMRFYQMTGSLEGGSMVPNTWGMHDTITNLGFGENELSTSIIEGGEHNEQLWKENFEEAYLWLFYSFANSINDQVITKEFIVSPNPVGEYLYLPIQFENKAERVTIYNTQGASVYKSSIFIQNSINVSELGSGFYIMQIVAGKNRYRGKFIKE
ncbi:MAG: alpha/beta hydrolase-fold protein [Bacteroidales bacterium]